jgi:hypothetical protein
MATADYRLKEFKLFNEREAYIIIEALRAERDASIKILEDIEKDGKRPLFTVEFIRQEMNQLIKKIEDNTKIHEADKERV